MGFSMVTDINKPISWLGVVIDYGKRFPDCEIGMLGLDFNENQKKCKLLNLRTNFGLAYGEMVLCCDGYEQVFFVCNSSNCLAYNTGTKLKPVPNHVLLRLLTEGKEDLI